MIINNNDAVNRLSSPHNLMNRLSSLKSKDRKGAMNLFIPPSAGVDVSVKRVTNEDIPEVTFNRRIKEDTQSTGLINLPAAPTITSLPDTQKSEESKIEQLIPNAEEQIKLAQAHDNALAVVNDAVRILHAKLDDIKADKLPSVIAAASRVVTDIRRERNEATKNQNNRDVHYHFYTPEQKTVSDYEIIDVT
jgi:hypothetical protein